MQYKYTQYTGQENFPITIVLWKWDNGLFTGDPRDGDHPKKHIKFTAEHVNIFGRMVKRNTTVPHRILCITDDPTGIEDSIETYPLWNDLRDLGGCYVRLKAFSKELEPVLGPKFIWMDLDCVITGNIDHILADESEIKFWGDTHPRTHYNGSMCMMKTGIHEEVWDTFDRERSPRVGRSHGFVGTDQAWISATLGPHLDKWTKADGIYSFRCHFERLGRRDLPQNACIVMFHGRHDPSMPEVQSKYQWVPRCWR